MSESVQTWATAISHQKDSDRKIVWRFAQHLRRGFDPSSQPDRIILAWKYSSKTGQPEPTEHRLMNLLEDALEPITEDGHVATLALVSTGEGLREWIFYARSAENFLDRLNTALAAQPAFPIEIHTASDPTWSTYTQFRTGVGGPTS